MSKLLTIKEASTWATAYLNKEVTKSNISYLIQYGRIPNKGNNGNAQILKDDLIDYYKKNGNSKEKLWKDKLGHDLNWNLSFSDYRESETTKHVHRLHPYKGKFIPQLVEYFLDAHIDEFKKEVYFNKGDIIFDPFSGSGTTLVQSSELEMHAIGIDISAFNTLITNVKVGEVDFQDLYIEINRITASLKSFISTNNNYSFENNLLAELNIFNKQFFPSPEFKIKVRQKQIDEKSYATKKENEFLDIYEKLVKKYNLKIKQDNNEKFLEKWYLQPVKNEIDFIFEHLKHVKNSTTKKIITIVLSRTIRSCRATTHADLATLKEPITKTYYCRKHGKICKPLFSILSWWERYSKDTIRRLSEYSKLKSTTYQVCLQGDARSIDLFLKLKEKNIQFGELAERKKISGIFSSPPYVGLINYHEQHAYAYDLFGFERNDELEIGPLYNGQGIAARKSYVEGISQVLLNSKNFLRNDYNIFLVSNDKYNMYPKIAEKSGLKIVNQYKRPVLNRTEKDKSAYAEIIFHMKEK